jgi:hypothetical protein
LLGVGNVGLYAGESVVMLGRGRHGGSKHGSRSPCFNV